MQRSRIGLAEIADLHNLAPAFRLAARGKRGRGDVEAFRGNLDAELAALRADLLDGSLPLGRMRQFAIRDPKPRIIHAPCFRERVVHHAIMAHVGPVLDRALVDDTYACRVGKGTLAAVQRISHHAERHDWFVQIDIRGYFASIVHGVLKDLLRRRLKDRALLGLLDRIIDGHHTVPGSGLPIGTLVSQHFANFYLAGADRLLLERCGARGYVRYMDDLVWWVADRSAARATLDAAERYLADSLHLAVKPSPRIARSRDGIAFCGFRVLPGRVLLSRRRRRRYREMRRDAERGWCAGQLDDVSLQAGYAAALALTLHADAAAWRRAELLRRPVEPALAGL